MNKLTDIHIRELLHELNSICMDIEPWECGIPYHGTYISENEWVDNTDSKLFYKAVRDWLDKHYLVLSEK